MLYKPSFWGMWQGCMMGGILVEAFMKKTARKGADCWTRKLKWFRITWWEMGSKGVEQMRLPVKSCWWIKLKPPSSGIEGKLCESHRCVSGRRSSMEEQIWWVQLKVDCNSTERLWVVVGWRGILGIFKRHVRNTNGEKGVLIL